MATTNDAADEADGSVTAAVGAGSGYTVSATAGTAAVAVRDDDDPAPVADPCVVALSGDGSVTGQWAAGCGSSARAGRYARFYTFSLDSPSRVTIDLESTADTYMYLRRVLGQKSGGVLASNDDGGDGYNSRISRRLEVGGYTIAATTYRASTAGPFTLTVDGIPAQTVVQPDPEVSVTAGADVTEGGDAVFTVSAVPTPASALDVTVAITATGDFGVSPGSRTVTITTSGSAVLTVATANDSTDEADGSVTATLNTGSGYTVSATASTAFVAVADDDDPAPTPSKPSITVGDATAGEGDGAIEFTVELSAASAGTVTVYYSIWDGTATAHDDYRPEWGSVVFAPGETSKTVPVSLIDDRTSGEGTETLTLRLRLFDTTHATLTDTSAQGTITDND